MARDSDEDGSPDTTDSPLPPDTPADSAVPGASSPLTWETAREALEVCLHRPNRWRIAAIAAVVGTVLVGINESSVLVSGRLGWALWARVALDYLIPTCVSTMGVLAGSRRTAAHGTVSDRSARPGRGRTGSSR